MIAGKPRKSAGKYKRSGKTYRMKKYLILLLSLMIVLIFSVAAWTADKSPLVREEAKIFIDGVEETWVLEWKGPTVPACAPEDADWNTCPCMGFAFGEAGELDLVRKRPGREDERLALTPLFRHDEAPGPDSERTWAVLRRWDVRANDQDNMESSTFPGSVKARPISKIMKFGDYDRDGRATEFLLQIGTLPCGKSMTIAVGISRKNPRLHAFSSLKKPEEPLILRTEQWASIRKTAASFRTVQWQCGDHGSEVQIEYLLQAGNGTIRATRRTYECTGKGKRGALQKEEAF